MSPGASEKRRKAKERQGLSIGLFSHFVAFAGAARVVELRTTLAIQAHNLAIEHGLVLGVDRGDKRGEALAQIALARNRTARTVARLMAQWTVL
jgi:hypothetical protein